MEFITQFLELKNLIHEARARAFQSVNRELVHLYWKVGEYVSNKLKQSEWGEGVVDQLAVYLKVEVPDVKGFDRTNLYRMVRFYDSYCSSVIVAAAPPQLSGSPKSREIVATASPQTPSGTVLDINMSSVMTQISWSHHITILNGCSTLEEKAYYIVMAHKEHWSVRELSRQIKSSVYERTMLANEKIPANFRQLPQASNIANIFKDSYVLEFLNLPEPHMEADLKKAILTNLKQFIIELGGDFAFIGEEFKLQVGTRDFRIDLLFYHRGLQCLVAFELKTEMFEPEFLGKINFYLEALDRDVRKPHENLSIGILLCKGKDDVVVEYALSRTLNPALVADYQLKLPNKRLLHDKWQEILNRAEGVQDE